MGLAVSVLALSTIGGLTTMAYLHQRQARATQVELTLNETTLLHNQALKAPDDLSRWQAAREAIKRVDVALGDDGNTQARLRLGDLRREVETGFTAARRDRELLDALAEIRSGHLGEARRNRHGLCRGLPPGRDRTRHPDSGRGRRPAPCPARRGGAPDAALPRYLVAHSP